MVAENEAVGRVKAVYQGIKEQFGIDFVMRDVVDSVD